MNDTQWLGQDATDRRSRILTAAQRVFAEKGFHAAEVQDIAELAGVSKATIYKVFASKDEILVTIVHDNFVVLREILLRHIVGPGDPMERLRDTCYAAARHLDEHKAFCRVLVKDAGEFLPEIQTRYQALVEENAPMADLFFGPLRDRLGMRDVTTPEMLRLLTNAGIGILYGWVLSDSGKLVDQVDFYFDIADRLTRARARDDRARVAGA